MKYTKKRLNLISVLFFISHGNFAAADLSSDAETIFNWAQASFIQYFPSNESTQTFDTWLFRFYPATSVYVGVNSVDSAVYVLGGEFGDTPSYVDTVQNLLALVGNNNGGQSDIAACDTTQAPAGIFYTQEGDTVTVTTNGQCIQLPDPETPICSAEPVKEETGISVLTDTDISSFILSGLTFENPDFPNPTDSIVQGVDENKSCVINAPSEFGAQTVNMDVCYDMTERMAGLQTIPGVVTVTPPVTMAMQGTLVNQFVSDCFATGAITVHDAFIDKSWVLQDGAYVEVN